MRRIQILLLFCLIIATTAAQHVCDRWRDIVKYSPDSMEEELFELCSEYPDLLQLDAIGMSVEDRPIYMLKMGKGPHRIVTLAAIHAREYITTTLMMKDVESMADCWRRGEKFGAYDIRKIMEQCTFYIIPMMNPDGVDIAQNGSAGRPAEFSRIPIAQRQLGYRSWKANANGVDLNRNFENGWTRGGAMVHNYPCSEYYKGTRPESEPETQALVNLLKKTSPVAVIAFHSQGQELYLSTPTPLSKNLAERVKKVTRYTPLRSGSPYGSLQDHVDKALGCFYACVELCPRVGQYPYPESKFYSVVWPRAAYVLPTIGEEMVVNPSRFETVPQEMDRMPLPYEDEYNLDVEYIDIAPVRAPIKAPKRKK